MQKFVCPFEAKGRREGTIIEVVLGEDKAARLTAMREAHIRLLTDLTRVAIEYTLPRSAWADCYSNLSLRPCIVPYQAEIVATDLDVRLYPFLAYHRFDRTQKKNEAAQRKHESAAAGSLNAALSKMKARVTDVGRLAEWISDQFAPLLLQGQGNPVLELRKRTRKGPVPTLSIDLSVAAVDVDAATASDPHRNRNVFSIVKTPFYPQAFGRYSEQVQIIVTRDADVCALSGEDQMRIRLAANLVHVQHGVVITDLGATQAPTGLWTPEEGMMRIGGDPA